MLWFPRESDCSVKRQAVQSEGMGFPILKGSFHIREAVFFFLVGVMA